MYILLVYQNKLTVLLEYLKVCFIRVIGHAVKHVIVKIEKYQFDKSFY